MLKWFAVAGCLLIAAPSFAQQAQPQVQPAPPPTDLEIEKARADMLLAQLQYFLNVLKRNEAQTQQKDIDAKVLASWWASYVAGLEAQK